MATMVYRGLPSCLESQFAEPRTLRLILSSPKPHFSHSLELNLKPGVLDFDTKEPTDKCHQEKINQKADVLPEKLASSNTQSGGWSFIEAISDTSQSQRESSMEKENTYVHPLVKRSSSRLSERSLELCTESLGSETGTTDIIETGIPLMSSSSDSEAGNSPTREQQKTRQLLGAKKARVPRSFPPPLTTMSGSESLQIRPHREDGRLIIKAVKVPSKQTYFQAERSNGRLRLFRVKYSDPNFDHAGLASTEQNSEESNKKENTENDVNYAGVEEEQERKENTENDVNYAGVEEEQEKKENTENDVNYAGVEEEQEDGSEEQVEDVNSECSEAEMDGNDLDIGNQNGSMEELQRSSEWCKAHEVNWNICCMATTS